MPCVARHVLFTLLLASTPWPVGAALAQDDPVRDPWQDSETLPVEVHGFGEAATAARVRSDPTQPDDFVLTEARFRLDLSHFGDRADLTVKADFTADALRDGIEVDVRQASVTLRPADWFDIDGDIRLDTVTLRTVDWLDLRAGRQVLTWGTGDLVFLNDLFPKDFVSFFIGRNDEILKAPLT